MSDRPGGVVVVGGKGGTNVASSLVAGADPGGPPVTLLDAGAASAGPRLARAFAWRALGRRPLRLREFSAAVVAECRRTRPRVLLTTGLAPVTADALRAVEDLGIARVNFLTDDPWNPAHRAGWFFRALPRYDVVFSPRTANAADLRAAGCRRVEYLPFGYDPALFYPDPGAGGPGADVLFVGGGDRDRAGLLGPLVGSGLDVALVGSYWDRYPETRRADRGQIDPAAVRRATTAAKVSLILVRRANRDGHVMRTYEAAACGGCLLVEDTPDHRALFGPDGETVVYFRTPSDLAARAAALVADENLRRRLSTAVLARVTTAGRHTYAARLRTLLEESPP